MENIETETKSTHLEVVLKSKTLCKLMKFIAKSPNIFASIEFLSIS